MRFVRFSILLLAALAVVSPRASGQDYPLELQGLLPTGGRTTLTETWGTLQFDVTNRNATPREARVVVYFVDQPAVRYSRDVWVPARSTISSTLALGPAPLQIYPNGCELHALLYDRTDGADKLILPATEEKVRSRLVRHRPRVPMTAMIVDAAIDPKNPLAIVDPVPATTEAIQLVHIVRGAAAQPDNLLVLSDGALPQTPEVLEGVDHIVLAGNRMLSDPVGLKGLRQWIQQGGRLWVMLDRVDPRIVDALIGDDAPFEIIDRVGLTTVQFHPPRATPGKQVERRHEMPIDLVRVLPSDIDQVLIGVNDWPAAFVRSVGRGRIVFTTLGARGWYRPRQPKEAPSRYDRLPNLPIGENSTDELVIELFPRDALHPFTTEDLRPLLIDEIGYSIMSQRTAIAVLGAFLLALVGIGVAIRRTRRPELVGWLAPAAAVGIGIVFLIWTTNSRRAIPPTTATVAIADAVPGSHDVAVSGLFAVYQPVSGPALVSSDAGAILNLDAEGLEGQSRVRVQSDAERWRWDDLSLPAGVRTGQFKYTARTGPLAAKAQFGPQGIAGTLTANGFHNWSDALISSRNRGFLNVQVGSDGKFTSSTADSLPNGQFIAGAILTDKQQRRQAAYSKLLGAATPRHVEGKDVLLVWCEPKDPPFVVPPGGRSIAATLLTIPLEFERTAAGSEVTIPAAFISNRRVDVGGKATLESNLATDMTLRFQLPQSVLPLRMERATFHLHMRAASRRVQVFSVANNQVELLDVESPVEPIAIEIAGDQIPQVDAQGGFQLRLKISNVGTEQLSNPWRIEALGVDVTGRTEGDR